MLERDQFTWRGMLLTLRGKAVANIVPSEVRMYRIAWPNGDVSPDHYNLPRAKQNAITTAPHEWCRTGWPRNALRGTAHAFC